MISRLYPPEGNKILVILWPSEEQAERNKTRHRSVGTFSVNKGTVDGAFKANFSHQFNSLLVNGGWDKAHQFLSCIYVFGEMS